MSLLKDIVSIEKGKKHNLLDEYEEGAIRVFQANDFRNENKPQYTLERNGVLANENDILVVWDGSVGQMGYGKIGFVGSTIARVRLKNQKEYSPIFIYKFLQTKSEFLKRKSTGATIQHINRKSLEQLEIPSISFSDQIEIANILCKAETLIEQRKQSITLLDEFLKSTFLEMFGDPVKREKKWEYESCGNLFDMKLGKMLSAKNYTGTHLKKYLRNVNVKWGEIDLSDVKEMDFNEKEVENYSLLKGDILVCEGGDVGRTAILKNDLKNYCYQNALHRLRIKDNKRIDANYFSWFMYLGVTKGLIKNATFSVTIQHFTQERFKKLQIPIPPIELQTQFANIVTKTKALKEQYKNSLQELENLYGSLSQRAFKGELKVKGKAVQ